MERNHQVRRSCRSTALTFGIALAVFGSVDAAAQQRQPQQLSFDLPADGAPNNNRAIGPFCCTGNTATIFDQFGAPLGYVYAYGFEGGINVDRAGYAERMGVLISGAADLASTASAQARNEIISNAADLAPGRVAYGSAGGLYFTVAVLSSDIRLIDRRNYVDINSLRVRVDVSTVPFVHPPNEPPIGVTCRLSGQLTGSGLANLVSIMVRGPNSASVYAKERPGGPGRYVLEALPIGAYDLTLDTGKLDGFFTVTPGTRHVICAQGEEIGDVDFDIR